MKPVIFTDLDGTLLDAADYSFEKALPALRLLRERDIPLVCCSSKTRKEIEHYRELLENRHPFVSENGGGVFIPNGYFGSVPMPAGIAACMEGDWTVIRLGAPYADLRAALIELREQGFAVRGFGDMTAEEIAALTGLSPAEAAMAKERDFDEPFLFNGSEEEVGNLVTAVEDMGFSITRGSFFHILGDSDKGKAVAILTGLYEKKFGEVVTVGLGDNPNDLPMLQRVDYPVAVMKPDGRHDPGLRVEGMTAAGGIGPEGWNEAVLTFLRRFPDGD